MGELTLTHCGKLGDFLYCLPIASWLAHERNCKIHFVLPVQFEPFRYVSNLLMAQPFVSRVTLVPHEVRDYMCGGQPYRFDPAAYGVSVNGNGYFNLGFREYPDKFISAYYAEEHAFGYDQDFMLELGHVEPGTSGEILRTQEGAMSRLQPDAAPIPPAMDLLDLAHRLKRAQEVYTWFCGIAVLCWFARIPAKVYRVPGHAPLENYFPEPRTLEFIEVPAQ